MNRPARAATVARPVALALALLAAIARPVHAQSISFPETPAGRAAAEALEVANGEPDSAALARFIADRFAPGFRDAFPLSEHVRIWREMMAESGGYDLREVRSGTDRRLEALLRARRDGALQVLDLEVEPEPPHRIMGMGIGPLDSRPEVPLGTAPTRELPDAEIAAELADYVDRLVAADRFSGVVLLVRDGRVVFDRAYGLADRADGVPVHGDTKFNLGSMNKMFTAVTIAKLAEQGRLSLEDPIGKWLGAEWIRPEVGAKVTIAHLLTHTSGLGSYFTPEFFDASRTRFREVRDYAPLVAGDSLAFEPGSRWAYSNTGFLLLGAIVESVTGRSYFEVVREVVYEPAGMTDTDAYSMDEVVPNLAVGYDPQFGPGGLRWRNNLFLHTIRGGPAGGGFSTAPDLLRFARALRENRLLSPEWTARVTTPKPELGSPGYGYGFQVWEDGSIGHGGGFPGISSVLKFDPQTDHALIVLSNVSMGQPAVTRKVEQLLRLDEPRAPGPPPPPTGNGSPARSTSEPRS
ncbi:MAG TPA: serine hydrolase domain-containing protein [Gemmatimonadota bacterium]|nr:serine hydrolase domain-containing protein [Gemmatimonadota bacterium]